MAYLGKNNQITGSLGDLVFRTLDGKTVIQRKPQKNKIKQTERTQKAASDFGRASTLAKKIRIGIKTYSRDFSDSKSFCRLRTRLQLAACTDNPAPIGEKKLWDGKPKLLEGFEFNYHSPYERYCRIVIKDIALASQKLHIKLKAFQPKKAITWPIKANKAKLCFWMSVHRKKDDLSVQEELFSLEILPNNKISPAINFVSNTINSSSIVYLWSGILYYQYDALLDWVCLNHKTLHPLRLQKVLKIDVSS
ncbi:MAG: hypothetical protein ACTJGD_08360 [Mesonia hippocampi]|uniref:Uncharacterized protein n=1 Tax=Mesonia hippocampi TaxID=1628250 RepID=A0A840EV26_9FLAO|nr:hypothetical protein [Mesonia hippocampi]MBB4118727.1 hypothetical protein [Mesonia hippocampi]